MLTQPPVQAWYRLPPPEPDGRELARIRARRDAATVRALRAYLASRPRTIVRTTVEVDL